MSSQKVVDISELKSISERLQQKAGEERDTKIFDLDTLPSIAESAIEPAKFLIEGLLVENAMGMISSEFGAGKSMLMLAIAHAIAHGIDWCGRKTQQRHVLYLDRENPAEILKERLVHMGISDTGPLKIWSLWHRDIDIFQNSLDCVEIALYVNKHPGCLIVVDSLVAFLPVGANENDAMHIREFMNLGRKLTALAASVIFLHHSGKSETAKKYRGSSDIGGSLDHGYTLVAEKGDGQQLLSVELQVFKQRTLLSNKVSLNFDGCRFSPGSGTHSLKSKDDRMLEYLRHHRGISHSDFTRGVGKEYPDLTEAIASAWLAKGELAGTIKVTGGIGKAHRRKSYWLVEDEGLNFDASA